MDIDDLILQIMDDSKVSRIYRDEPILRRASTMDNYMPQQYRQMRRIALQNGRRERTPAEIFRLQGEYMAQFEDDYDYKGEFIRYFPTYQTMSDAQLRGYFSWRTQVRRGNICKTSVSFVFVYIYELLNCIGVADAQEGFDTLKKFYAVYRTMDMQIERYMQVWLRDFVVYYGLDPALLEDMPAAQHDRALAVLIDCASHTDEALYAAICTLSSYNPATSRYGKQYPDRMRTAVCATFRELSEYYAKNRKYTLCEAFFGRSFTTPYVMFNAALFCPDTPQAERTVSVTPLCSYTCRKGKWYCTRIWGKAARSADLGVVMKATDSALRARSGFPHPLKTDARTPKYVTKLLERTLDACEVQQSREAVVQVQVDLSKLQGIRDAAAITRDRLIVEEPPEEPVPEVPSIPEPMPPAEDPLGLDEAERRTLCSLLLGQSPQPYLREKGLLLSVVTDAINEKCFDLFADTVLLFDGDTPQVIEDYADELKGMLHL